MRRLEWGRLRAKQSLTLIERKEIDSKEIVRDMRRVEKIETGRSARCLYMWTVGAQRSRKWRERKIVWEMERERKRESEKERYSPRHSFPDISNCFLIFLYYFSFLSGHRETLIRCEKSRERRISLVPCWKIQPHSRLDYFSEQLKSRTEGEETTIRQRGASGVFDPYKKFWRDNRQLWTSMPKPGGFQKEQRKRNPVRKQSKVTASLIAKAENFPIVQEHQCNNTLSKFIATGFAKKIWRWSRLLARIL